MGRTRSVALITLISLCLTAYAQENAVSAKKQKTAVKAKYSSRFNLGLSSWTESIKINRLSDNRKFDASSSLWSLTLGYQWHRVNSALWGFMLEAQGLYGKNASESRDSQLVYYKNNDPMYGADFGVGGYKILARPNVSAGLGLNLLWRNVRYTEPSGFAFDKEKQKVHYATKLSFAWPLTDHIDLIQQFSIFIDEPGTVWLLGLRL